LQRSPLLLAAIPAAVLTGLALSAPIMAYAATLKSSGNFNALFRFGITPLFLFSGTFFPIEQLPEPLRILAWATPLFHGVALVRGLTLGTAEGPGWFFLHPLYLGVMVAAGAAAAVWTFNRKLRV
jgi:lipooligosaccharide transport system permease protein